MTTIIFSKDRAMQCRLCLETFFENVKEKETSVVVLYNTTSDRHEASYEILKKEQPHVSFIKEVSFQDDLLKILANKIYVLFVVDDCIFTRPFSIQECEDVLRLNHIAIGISLRLGVNTNYCYPINEKQNIPDFMSINGNKMIFNWQTSQYDFNYPLELSSSLYKIETIETILHKGKYNNPNELEWLFYNNLKMYQLKPLLISFKESVAFCNPINKTRDNTNRSGVNQDYSIDSLLTKFEKGGRISTKQFRNFITNSAHQEEDIKIEYR